MGRLVLLVVAVAGCGRVGFDELTSGPGGSNASDAADAAPDTMCGAVDQQTLACDAPQTGTFAQERTYDCGVGDWTAWMLVANNCICNTSSQPRQFSCPGGILMQQRDFQCPAAMWTAWMNTTETCTGLVWQPFTDGTGPFATALTATVGATCAPTGTMMACSSQAGGGMFWHYASCTCQ